MEQSLEVLRVLITTSLLVVSPILLVSLVVGVTVSLLQSVTSIQEATLSFVPKLIAIALAIVLCAPWILRTLMQLTTSFLTRLPEMVR
ncbi:MAG: flagellar biosynthetic protein FliQ [Chthoniobacteraceae bacterium]